MEEDSTQTDVFHAVFHKRVCCPFGGDMKQAASSDRTGLKRLLVSVEKNKLQIPADDSAFKNEIPPSTCIAHRKTMQTICQHDPPTTIK